jgi:hypothetical protein
MNFSNSRNQIIPLNQNQNTPLMPFSNRYIQFKNKQDMTKRDAEQNNPSSQTIMEKPIEKSKMKWGEPTWFLFHVLAEKVKEESFLEIRSELLNKIYAICNNLPCPICAKHATDYMNNVNFMTIQSKDALRDLLFNFHNEVNKNKKYPLFPRNRLEEKYKMAVTVNIIKNFMKFFEDKQYNVQLISNKMHRDRLISILKVWFNENMSHFDN